MGSRVSRSVWVYLGAEVIVLLALVFASAMGDAAQEADLRPPSDVHVTPMPEGEALNISWDAEGTNATCFKVVWRLDEDHNAVLGTTERPWFVHDGIAAGQPYSYTVVSYDKGTGNSSEPSKVVTGWPYPLGGFDPLMPPTLDMLPRYVSEPTLEVTGTASWPGTHIEVVTVPLVIGKAINHTIPSDELTGRFSTVVELQEGMNLVHARVYSPEDPGGRWSTAFNVTLDTVAPVPRVTAINDTIEIGSFVRTSAEESTDNVGIFSCEWHLGGPQRLTMYGWVFNYYFTDVGNYTLDVNVSDPSGNVGNQRFNITVRPPDLAPQFIKLPDKISVNVGGRRSLDMSKWVEDGDDPVDRLNWTVSSGNESLFTVANDGSRLSLATFKGTTGEALLTISVWDPMGKRDEAVVLVTVNSRSDEGSGAAGLSLLVLALVGGIIGLAMVVGVRRRLQFEEAEAEGETTPFFVKAVYLIHDDGRLIADVQTGEENIKDSDMVSSMFTAIQDFVRDSFNENAPLENIVFGENHLTISSGKHIYLATVSFGQLNKGYMEKARELVRRIEAEYAGVIEDWDGTYSKLAGVEELVEALVRPHQDRTLEDVRRESVTEAFCATPSLEFHHGFVKYNLDLANNTEAIIVDPAVDVHWDRQVLSLVKVKPEGVRLDGRFRVDNIMPFEKKRLELYFDPQVCLESFLRGGVTYTDIRGRLHTMEVESVLADINCPIFFTPDNANTAMLRRLVEELEHKDNKVFRYTGMLRPRDIYELAKDAVSSYDVKYVMEYIDEEPFMGEAWFYGETKIYNYKVVIVATVREEDHTVELFVAASLPTTITGLLAELGQLFLMKMDQKYTHGYNVQRVVKRLVKEDMSDEYLRQHGQPVKRPADEDHRSRDD